MYNIGPADISTVDKTHVMIMIMNDRWILMYNIMYHSCSGITINSEFLTII
jgi:hypothetical protein